MTASCHSSKRRREASKLAECVGESQSLKPVKCYLPFYFCYVMMKISSHFIAMARRLSCDKCFTHMLCTGSSPSFIATIYVHRIDSIKQNVVTGEKPVQ